LAAERADAGRTPRGHVSADHFSRHCVPVSQSVDELETPATELDDYSVIRCWRFNTVSNAKRVLAHIRELKPDVVWFNLGFSSYGDRPAAAFAGICIPALTRIGGYYTHVTLHQVIDYISMKDAGVRFLGLYRAAGYLATRLVLMSNSISVLLPAYRRTLREKYRGANVHVRMHGILSSRPEYPDFHRRGNPTHRVLAFGKWGTYKRLEQMLEVFSLVARRVPNAQLVIAGGDHPKTPGYVASVAQKYQHNPQIVFTGYVPEDKIPDLFQSATVAVMPYSSAAGSSGVAHLAAAYGLPIICADIADFREMADDENLAIAFYETGDLQSLAKQLIDLLESPERQQQMAEQNFSAAMRMTMPQIVRQYLRAFDVHQRTRALEPLRRFRRIPTWVSTRSALARAVSARTAPWM
jgi:glycosyltransferase involved in cell wall biosynthesis